MKVIYPVLFYEEKEGGYSVFVPDLEKALNTNASTCGDTLEEAMNMSEDLIAGLISVYTKQQKIFLRFFIPMQQIYMKEKIWIQ